MSLLEGQGSETQKTTMERNEGFCEYTYALSDTLADLDIGQGSFGLALFRFVEGLLSQSRIPERGPSFTAVRHFLQ
jgi:hypothetical protein